jgi:hypothetical protein
MGMAYQSGSAPEAIAQLQLPGIVPHDLAAQNTFALRIQLQRQNPGADLDYRQARPAIQENLEFTWFAVGSC